MSSRTHRMGARQPEAEVTGVGKDGRAGALGTEVGSREEKGEVKRKSASKGKKGRVNSKRGHKMRELRTEWWRSALAGEGSGKTTERGGPNERGRRQGGGWRGGGSPK